MKLIPRTVVLFCLLLSLHLLSWAQQTEPALQVILDQGKVRFTARQPEWQVHLAVANQRGETLYDSGHNHFGALEWNLTDRENQPLAGGLYRYTLTLQDSAGATVRRHQGSFILEQDAQHLWITAQDETALGADILGGALTATRAAGRTLAGRDPADQARRSVDGRKLVTGDGETKPSEAGLLLAPNAPTSTVNSLAKFTNTGGAVNDSNVYEVGGNVGIGTQTPQNALDVVKSSPGVMNKGFYETASVERPGDVKFGIYNSDPNPIAAALTFGATRFLDANSRYPGFELQHVIASATASNRMRFNFIERNSGGTVVAFVADILNVLGNGNVGIGTTAPAHRLHVVNSSGNAIFGETSLANSAGVQGNTTVANGYGVCGTTNATNGYGVFGYAGGVNGYGVFGQATGAGYGVVGTNTDLVNGTAGQFNGHVNVSNTLAVATNGLLRVDSIRPNVGSSAVTLTGNLAVVGSLSKTDGSFKIDHPLDPANKYLYHSFVESPDMMNIYNGNVTTDQLGLAVITLPDYFETLNREFRYQLTVIGKFAQAIVSEEISGNQFRIETSQPNTKVSWMVTGVRQDAYAEAHRIPTEELKSETERGSYLHPEVHGQPEEKGLEWVRQPEMMKRLKEQREKTEKEKRHQ
ncbi:MAG: hypothetical protein HOP19_14805 [Acidobacteria bacterium]|nr:hypothetical protein [Acidobacteriota bacterium]